LPANGFPNGGLGVAKVFETGEGKAKGCELRPSVGASERAVAKEWASAAVPGAG
jgi:hypothetical protein